MYEWIGIITKHRRLWAKVAWGCSLFPNTILLLLCKCLGDVWYALSRKGLAVRVQSNMQDLLNERSGKRLRGYCRSYFHNLVITMFELWIESYRLEKMAGQRFQAEGEEHLEEALLLGRGAIVYTPHVGNFFYYYWYLCQKYPCLTIVTSGSEELQPMYHRFRDMGCAGLDYDATPPLELIRKLRHHLAASGVVFLLGDFYRPTFPLSRFFGKSTRTPEGAASLGIDYQVPIIPFHGRRIRRFVHKLTFEQPVHLYASYQRTQRAEATKVLNRYMERVIREAPEHWFYWFNAEERWEEGSRHAAEHNTLSMDTSDEKNSHTSYSA
ncbi:lipid A biosynthesis acyltransferase [Paenibacillus sp. 32352]|uniref:LpxL/LpxP family acyltransferase n=1 Tax=Paenibacillus sp. 32352 TaxID=1969111 RepID=UPI0009AF1124|nr:lipid A biosynthesis acyltransferase [Paenibacillus sp. 32352]